MSSRERLSSVPQGIDGGESLSFDCSLPVMHKYLGQNLNEIGGRTVLDDWSYHTIPLLDHLCVILVPGQTLPLYETDPDRIEMLKTCIKKDHLFGSVALLDVRDIDSSEIPDIAGVGTIAEIFESRTSDNGGSLLVKAIGRQRFRIVAVTRMLGGLLRAKVQILPEIILPDPMEEIRIGALNRFRFSSKKTRSILRRDAMTAQWPSWVYSQFRLSSIINRVRQVLSTKNLGPNVGIPEDPVALSFWLVRAIPMDNHERVALLRLNSAIMRLQFFLKKHEQQSAVLCCVLCQSPVANKSDIFTMSVEGALGAYVNSYGYIHEIITVYKTKNISLQGHAPTDEFSWFPGYAWQIAQCRDCSRHIGWRFTAVNPNLKPASFWALANKSVRCRDVTENKDQV